VILGKHIIAKGKAEKWPVEWGKTKMKNRIRAVAIVSILAFSLLCSSVYARDDESTRETLQGFDSMMILIGELKPEIERAGLTTDQLRTDVELKLRLAGIKLLTATDCFFEYGRPHLSVNVTVLKPEGVVGYVYLVNLNFFQKAILVRQWNKNVPTWSIGYLGFTPHLNGIRNNVNAQVDVFLNAWQSVNTKKYMDSRLP
jgi:hypothetical protein